MNMNFNNRDKCIPFTTKDGSTIREILLAENQSLAEAIVSPGQTTAPHYHLKSEEIYYILRGQGTLFVDDEKLHVSRGDAVLIPAGKQHSIYNSGAEELIFLCCCAPGYKHEDTILV
jgi:mannose-6-phosphate isomerase-like protein (cupin superfamily)